MIISDEFMIHNTNISLNYQICDLVHFMETLKQRIRTKPKTMFCLI